MPTDSDQPNLFETNPELREIILSKLTEALLDQDPDVRRIALLNLGRVGDEAFRAVPALDHILRNDPQPELRRLAASVLGGLGPRALAFLIHPFTDNNQATRDAVREIFRAQPIPPRDVLPALFAASLDADPLYRQQAITALFYILDGRIDRDYYYLDEQTYSLAQAIFHRALNDSDEMVRLVAAYGLWIVWREESGVSLIEEIASQSDSPHHDLASKMLNAVNAGREND